MPLGASLRRLAHLHRRRGVRGALNSTPRASPFFLSALAARSTSSAPSPSWPSWRRPPAVASRRTRPLRRFSAAAAAPAKGHPTDDDDDDEDGGGGGDDNNNAGAADTSARALSHAGATSLTMPPPDPKWAETPFSSRVFATLGLSDFSEDDLHAAFDRADRNHDGRLDRGELRALVADTEGGHLSVEQIDEFTDALWKHESAGADLTAITEAQFKERTRSLALELDPRVKQIAAMFLCSGMSIGVIMPVMPQLVDHLGISAAQYGLVVGAFAGTKMLANMPAASLVERFGRKRVLTAGMAVIGASFFGIGAAYSYEHLMLCRGCTGIGVAAFMTSATLYLSDISTPLNRAKTLAPPMTAFSAGAALGPALGGVLADTVGISGTFATVGASFAALAVANQTFLPESKQPAEVKEAGTGGGGGGGGAAPTAARWRSGAACSRTTVSAT